MADTNFLLLLTLRKPETQTLGGWFCSKTCFWGAMTIFPIFHNGRHQFSASVDTRETGDQTLWGQ